VTDTAYRVIGRYEIQRPIGAGGMGVLFLARDPVIDRLLAIKLMREGLESASSRERFIREARSAGRLHHPNLVTIFDVGEHEGQPFIAMQYIEGETLADLIQRQANVSVARKLRWMEDLCAGLHYAHRAGIIHRDMKPANVMVDRDGAVKILDFGIARFGGAGLTQGGVVGTLNYMAPEQMAGLPVDARADVFSLGALLYELLAYRRAFPGGVADGILAKIMYRSPVALDQIIPDIDPDLAGIVDRCLAKKAADRYQDCIALAQDVASLRLRIEQRSLGDAREHETGSGVSIGDPIDNPRRVRQREELLRIRAEEIHAHLARAQSAMAQGAYADALRECERALVLDPGHEAAAVLADTARSALEEQQIDRWLTEGQQELGRGALTAASLLADRALSLNSSAPEALALRAAIDDARREMAEAEERARGVEDARTTADTRLQAGALENAVTAAAVVTEMAVVPLAVSTESRRPAEGFGAATTYIADLAAAPPRRLAERFRRTPVFAAVVVVLAAGWLMAWRIWRTPGDSAATKVPSSQESIAQAPPAAVEQGSRGADRPIPQPTVPQPASAAERPRPVDSGRAQQPVAPQAAAPRVPDRTAPASAPAPSVAAPPRPPDPPPVIATETGVSSNTPLGLSEPAPTTPPPAVRPAPTETENPATARAADEAAIRAVLAEYKAAYERMDATALQRLLSLRADQAQQLASQFRDYRSYTLQMTDVSIAVTGASAIVTCLINRTFVPKVGRSDRNTSRTQFSLAKSGAGWHMTGVAAAR